MYLNIYNQTIKAKVFLGSKKKMYFTPTTGWLQENSNFVEQLSSPTADSMDQGKRKGKNQTPKHFHQ
jgi:hypothetical protein